MARINISLPGESAKESLYALAADLDCRGQRGPAVSELMSELARLYNLEPETLVEMIQVAQGVAAGNDLDDWFLAQQYRVLQERRSAARYWYLFESGIADAIWLPGTAQNLAGAMHEAALLYECDDPDCPPDARIVVAGQEVDGSRARYAVRDAVVGGQWKIMPPV